MTAERRRIAGLTAANLWASGSSMVVLVLAARSMGGGELGRFTIALAASQLIVLVADAGLTQYLVREIVRRNDLAPLGWMVRRRLVITVVVSAPTGLVVLGGDVAGACALVLATAGSALYAAQLAALQGLERPRALIRLQTANGVVFVVLGLVAWAVSARSTGFLLAIGGSYAALLVATVPLWRDGLRQRGFHPTLAAQSPFMVAAAANAVNSSIDTLLLGSRSRGWAGEYALAQRPGLAFTALTNAMVAVLLPRYSRRAPTRLDVARALWRYLATLLAGALVGAAVAPVLRFLYGGHDVSTDVVVLVFAAYAADVAVVPVSAALMGSGHERRLATVAVAQVVVSGALILALLDQGPLGVAVGLASGRLFGFALLLVLARQAEAPVTAPGRRD